MFNDVHIPMTIPQDETLTGYLSDVASRDFTAVKIIDAREDRTRIGFRRNGFGQETADILSDEPVEIVVQRAVETMLANNGHKLADSGIQVTGAISAFWIEQDWNYYDTEFIARIECELVFSIQHDELYRNAYSGSYNHRSFHAVSAKPWRIAMNGALTSLAEDIAYDTGLATALSQRTAG
ncbi:MAG: YajG family lipoprotein [Gammaproteobacteria bacterium]|nr:YajG family lipoprotein [Gammaproteobacteria bacterium]